MSLTRREFLRGMGGILAAGVAPAFIGSDVLMPVKKIWTGDDTVYVDNIAQLRELATPRKRVVVRGYYAPGDGGGGDFAWTSGAKPDNGGTIVGPYERVVRGGMVDVRWFGAQTWADAARNGSALQRAIEAAAFRNGVAIPAGLWRV